MKKTPLALLFVALVAVALLALWRWQAQQRELQVQALVQAASDWHLAPGELSGQGESMQESEHLLGGSWQLTGSRPVTLAGRQALMLRFQDGAAMSLFQLPAKSMPDLTGLPLKESPQLHFARGQSVSLWQERDTLMLMVQAPAADAIAAPELQAPPLPVTAE